MTLSARSPVLRGLARVLLLVGLCSIAPAWAQYDDTVAAQQKIEAAYLFKFGGYVTWPDRAFSGPNSPIVIGVAGSDAVADDLEALADGRNIGGRPISVRRLRAGDALDGVHILFVAPGAIHADTLIAAAHGNYTLAVTEGADGLSRGTDMTFVVVDNRVRFDVDLNTVQQSGLKLSSALLSVARNISGDKP
jgi:hypothetical protein